MHDPFRVALAHTKNSHYSAPPFHPPQAFGELSFNGPFDPANEIYAQVRELFLSLGYDKDHANSTQWNPLADFISPGNLVVIKPNLVYHTHPLGRDGVLSMITNGAVIRPIIDYAWKALSGKGEIVIADVPLQTANWESMTKDNGLQELVTYLQSQGIAISLIDLRHERALMNEHGAITKRILWDGDPRGYAPVDLKKDSALIPIINHAKKFRITDYSAGTVEKHHTPEKNEYLIAKTILAADVFINVPKLKTHKKAGVTIAMKNLIGINGDKSWIAHHRDGEPHLGGDEFPKKDWWDTFRYRTYTILKESAVGRFILSLAVFILKSLTKQQGKTKINSPLLSFRGLTQGSWYGNDTLWRVIHDLNRIILYADKNGIMQTTLQRKYLAIVDGVLAGEGDGPMRHRPKEARTLFAGNHPIAVDMVAAHFMGFDYKKIPQLSHAFTLHRYALAPTSTEQISVVTASDSTLLPNWEPQSTPFFPPHTWRNHIETPSTASYLHEHAASFKNLPGLANGE